MQSGETPVGGGRASLNLSALKRPLIPLNSIKVLDYKRPAESQRARRTLPPRHSGKVLS